VIVSDGGIASSLASPEIVAAGSRDAGAPVGAADVGCGSIGS
jgi:hypothetical protein